MQSAISRRSFLVAVPLAIGALATLSGCGEDSDGEPLDLTGTWSDYDEDAGQAYMTAVIEDDEITVYWGDNIDNLFSVFWAGSYEAPNKATESWSWESKKDEDRYGLSFFPSDSDTIEFTYKDGVLTFNATWSGLTRIEEMRRVSNESNVIVAEEVEEPEEAEADDSGSTRVYWTVNGIEQSVGMPTDDPYGINITMIVGTVMETTIFIVKEGRALEYSEYNNSGYSPSDLHSSTSGGIVTVTCTIDGIPVQFEVPKDIDYNELAAMVVDITLDALRQAGEY